MGLPLLAAVGDAGIPTVVIEGSYGMEGEVAVDVSTTQLDIHQRCNARRENRNRRRCDVDRRDPRATSGEAPEMGVILGVIIAIEKGEGRARLNQERPEWPIRSLARIEIVDGEVQMAE